MKTRYFSLALGALLLPLAGCGDSVDNTPPAAVMAPRKASAPKKIPSTVEEKIAAIEAAGLPPDQKQREIEKVKAGG